MLAVHSDCVLESKVGLTDFRCHLLVLYACGIQHLGEGRLAGRHTEGLRGHCVPGWYSRVTEEGLGDRSVVMLKPSSLPFSVP